MPLCRSGVGDHPETEESDTGQSIPGEHLLPMMEAPKGLPEHAGLIGLAVIRHESGGCSRQQPPPALDAFDHE